jgi:hypothetical protein
MKRKPEAGSQCEYATRSSRGLATRFSMSWQPVHSGWYTLGVWHKVGVVRVRLFKEVSLPCSIPAVG